MFVYKVATLQLTKSPISNNSRHMPMSLVGAYSCHQRKNTNQNFKYFYDSAYSYPQPQNLFDMTFNAFF